MSTLGTVAYVATVGTFKLDGNRTPTGCTDAPAVSSLVFATPHQLECQVSSEFSDTEHRAVEFVIVQQPVDVPCRERKNDIAKAAVRSACTGHLVDQANRYCKVVACRSIHICDVVSEFRDRKLAERCDHVFVAQSKHVHADDERRCGAASHLGRFVGVGVVVHVVDHALEHFGFVIVNCDDAGLGFLGLI